jgi:hypothetical protein
MGSFRASCDVRHLPIWVRIWTRSLMAEGRLRPTRASVATVPTAAQARIAGRRTPARPRACPTVAPAQTAAAEPTGATSRDRTTPDRGQREHLGCGPSAPWRSGYAAACKAAYTGSIPVGASSPCLNSDRLRREGRRRCAAHLRAAHVVRLVRLIQDGLQRLVAFVADHEVDEAPGPSVVPPDTGVKAFVLTHTPSFRSAASTMRPPAPLGKGSPTHSPLISVNAFGSDQPRAW